MRYWQCLFILFACQCTGVFASQHSDSISPKKELIQLRLNYSKQAAGNSSLYTGSEYEPVRFPLSEGIPFFPSADWVKGTLLYQHVEYADIELKYDQVQDRLITPYSDKDIILALVMEKVNGFTIAGHHFIYMRFPASTAVHPPEGIYDELFKGNLKIYVKRESVIEESISNNTVVHKVVNKNRYYLFQRDLYIEFSSKKELIKLLNLTRGKANACLRSQQLRFNKEPEKSMTALVELAGKQAQ